MIKFERYSHINDIFDYYSNKIDEDIIYKIKTEATTFIAYNSMA